GFLVDAIPVALATLLRFFEGIETLSALGRAFFGRGQHDVALDTAIEIVRRRRRRRASAIRRAGQRPPPAMRRFRRSRRMIASSSMPFVATATRFPPPAPALLDPHPLATPIRPGSAIP